MSDALPRPLQEMYERLVAISLPVAQAYAPVAPAIYEALAAPHFAQWEQHCLRLAQCGWRTWESAVTFLTHSPFLVQHLDAAALRDWAEHGISIARDSADAATAFFHAARPLLRHASQEVFAPWVAGGQWYLKHCPTRPSLVADYFRISPLIYGWYPLPVCATWQHVGQRLTQMGAQHGQAFLTLSRTLLDQAAEIDLLPAWEMAECLVPYAAGTALHYLERYPDLAQRFGSESMAQVHSIMVQLLGPTAAAADAFVRLIGGTLSFLGTAERLQVLAWCQQIAAVSPSGTLDFLRHCDALHRLLPGKRLDSWVTAGIAVAQRQAEAGQAYFALESAAAQDRLQALQKLVAFHDVERVLQLYTEGLLDRRVVLKTTAVLPTQLRAAGRDLPTTDGTAIFVPEQVDEFAEAKENFAVYKVAILHQVGFYECETFTFTVQEWLHRMPGIMQRLAALGGQPRQKQPATAFEQFFAMFPRVELARQLFTMLEDARIDAHLARRYKGIRPALDLVMQHSLQQRPPLTGLPLRHALLEGLLQLTLGAALPTAAALPSTLRILFQLLAQRLQPLLQDGATVYDTAAAVVDCYRLIADIPARATTVFSASTAAHIEEVVAQLTDDAEMLDLAKVFRQAGAGADVMPTLPDSGEPAEGIEPIPYRGEMKPELIQKQLRVQELAEALQHMQDAVSPIPPEILKELLEQGNIEITSVQEGDLSATSGLFVSDLAGRNGINSQDVTRHAALQQEMEALRAELHEAYGELASQGQAVLYDEWDYQIGDYRRRWCRLTETVLDEGDTGFVAETRHKYADLLTLVSRQFQLLKPEMFKKIKRLVDGEDIDLDSAIEAIVDRRAGNLLSDKVYMRRNKRDRSVAALFLLDMSASTDDEVKDPDETETPKTPVKKPPRQYDFSGFVRDDYYAPLASPSASEPPRRRIIDVEKEALVLMAEALEAIGDAYAVYGFSGYGRDQVDFYVAKEFTDHYDERVQGRIAAIKPHRSTRMGPAIRHAIRKLERQDARIKTLLLLSDGYPQDYDYGKDRKSKDYGIQDTMMALREAHLKGIQTFCITVDPSGHDYLREMCPDQQYMVLEDIASLPKELPKVYRGLTT